MQVQIQRVEGNSFPLPKYAVKGDAGMDLIADNFKAFYEVGNNKIDLEGKDMPELTLIPGARVLIGTGIKVAVPEGFVMDIRPRSGLALKQGITVLNSPGTIDSGFRLEVGVIVINHSSDAITIKFGDRIAQAVFLAVATVIWKEVDELNTTDRKGGFGSTDIKTVDPITEHWNRVNKD